MRRAQGLVVRKTLRVEPRKHPTAHAASVALILVTFLHALNVHLFYAALTTEWMPSHIARTNACSHSVFLARFSLATSCHLLASPCCSVWEASKRSESRPLRVGKKPRCCRNAFGLGPAFLWQPLKGCGTPGTFRSLSGDVPSIVLQEAFRCWKGYLAPRRCLGFNTSSRAQGFGAAQTWPSEPQGGAILWMNRIPHRSELWKDGSPVNSNKQWFPMSEGISQPSTVAT